MTEPQQPQQPTAPDTQMAPQQPPVPQAPAQQPYPPQQGYPAQPGYPPPVQPGYPPQFPGLPPGSAVPGPPAGSNFSSGKGKTIGLIVAGVVTVGALGGIAALVLGGGDDEQRPTASGGQNSGILDPKPVGTTAPEPAQPTESTEPTAPAEPAEPTPTPEPPADPPATDGGFITLPGNGLQVYVPAGWQANDPGDFAVSLGDGEGASGYVLTGAGDASLEAGALISQNLETMLPGATYTYELLDPQPLNPFGSIVSLASVDYEGTYVDAQSALPVVGRIFGAVRSDGSAMLILGEHGSREDFRANADAYNELLNETLQAFGGS